MRVERRKRYFSFAHNTFVIEYILFIVYFNERIFYDRPKVFNKYIFIILKNITPFFLTQRQLFLFYKHTLNIKLTALKRDSLLKTRQKVSRSKFIGATERRDVRKRDNPVLNTLNAH